MSHTICLCSSTSVLPLFPSDPPRVSNSILPLRPRKCRTMNEFSGVTHPFPDKQCHQLYMLRYLSANLIRRLILHRHHPDDGVSTVVPFALFLSLPALLLPLRYHVGYASSYGSMNLPHHEVDWLPHENR